MERKILVTSALPYANGPIHLGHMLEAVQTDIWVRYQKSIGNECYFFCADDTHGTPIMLAAKKENISPKELVKKVWEEHYRDLTGFLIQYDNYYTTDSEENRGFAEEIYNNLKTSGHISNREIEQSYCEHDKMFLPDRFIKGTCPKCGTPDQYGDGCEVCGSNYSPKDLKDSKCAICSSVPVLKPSKHLFFKLNDFRNELHSWMNDPSHLQESAKNKLMEWFEVGLQEWDISRDGPYFGFKIPGEENKYFYVWLDAPIGYIASSKNYFKESEAFYEFWKKPKENTEVVHFIGKDILYFHALFWPAMLMGSGFNVPSRVQVHGFLTVNGEKMSKSRGTFIKASTYLKHLNPEHFRFYLASKLNDGLDDIDLNLDDFVSRINSDLVGNLVNIVSRVSTSILDKLDRTLGSVSEEGKEIIDQFLNAESSIKNYYETKNYSKVMKELTTLGDIVNRYVNDKAPWVLIKTEPEKTREVITTTLNAAKIIAVYMYPVTPNISLKIFELLNLNKEDLNFSNTNSLLENTKVNIYKPLSVRVDDKAIKMMVEESKEATSNKEKRKEDKKSMDLITINDLAKVDLRVGLIKNANYVENSDKLLHLEVDLGEVGIKNVFAGIKSAYKPEELIGLKVVIVANLEPRKMKFGVSEAMILATGKDADLSLMVPHRNSQAGDKLK
ncbi:MAG: methionine--tRNA ligase [Leptospiraceae bacterium]|nr:methionine--tRNA ligase [Leptospiraceae bacterium]MCP5494037.1 methionine--tRNA ligase [Leptospiraceae bacterium]